MDSCLFLYLLLILKNFLIYSYFRHFRLYQYAFSTRPDIDLVQIEITDPTPSVRPLEEGIMEHNSYSTNSLVSTPWKNALQSRGGLSSAGSIRIDEYAIIKGSGARFARAMRSEMEQKMILRQAEYQAEVARLEEEIALLRSRAA